MKPQQETTENKSSSREKVHKSIYILPNLFTTANLFCGYLSIIYSIKGEFHIGAYAIVIAALFDLLDGRVARMTHTTSAFGEQYDSLSDLVSFGMAPSLLLFLWALQPFGRIGWLASFLFLACGALRLARFNVQSHSQHGYFTGLPIPMAAGIVASSVLAYDELNLEGSKSIWLLIITFAVGLCMVSHFPYRSFKDVDFKQKLPFKYLVLGVILFTAVAIRPEVMFFILFLSYALLGAAFGVFRFGLKKKKQRSK